MVWVRMRIILAYLCVYAYEVHGSCNLFKIQSWMDVSLVDCMCVWLALGFGLVVWYGRVVVVVTVIVVVAVVAEEVATGGIKGLMGTINTLVALLVIGALINVVNAATMAGRIVTCLRLCVRARLII